MLFKKPSFLGQLARKLILKMTSSALFGKKVQRGEHLTLGIEPQWLCPRGYELEVIEQTHFKMEFLKKQPLNPKAVVLQIHGGGYIGKLRNVHRRMGKFYAIVGKGVGVLMPDYRVAPEHPYPAALEDTVAAYQWLLSNGYSENQIIVAGDSAGGGLALALCLFLKEKDMPMPAGVIVMSPWADQTASGRSYKYNFSRDPLFGNTEDSVLFNRAYLGKTNAEKPLVSPLFGDFHGFPPMLIQVGSIEMLLSDSIAVSNKAKAAGVNVDFQVYEGMYHDFQMAGALIPESKTAWLEIGKFIHRVCGVT